MKKDDSLTDKSNEVLAGIADYFGYTKNLSTGKAEDPELLGYIDYLSWILEMIPDNFRYSNSKEDLGEYLELYKKEELSEYEEIRKKELKNILEEQDIIESFLRIKLKWKLNKNQEITPSVIDFQWKRTKQILDK